ncbi:MAG: M1 family aminopeptidase [Candidatus Acidiferrales bacterium]
MILKESREVDFVPGQAPSLRVRADYVLQNDGNGALAFIDVILPAQKQFGRGDVHAKIDNRDARLVSLPVEYQQDSPNALRIPLDRPWAPKEKRRLSIEYFLSAPEDSGESITLGPDNFYLGARGWFPLPQPPKHIFAPYPKKPDRSAFVVGVPADFLVLGRGTPAGQKREDGEIDHRFELGKNDLSPFAVAGHYLESSHNAPMGAVVFWTLQPPSGSLDTAANQIAGAWATLLHEFGPLDKNIRFPHIVESPEVHAHLPGDTGAAVVPFPGGALANSAAFALGVDNAEFLEKVEHALAHNWFGDQMYPTPDAAIGIGEGLPDYATIVIDEAQNGEAGRRHRIVDLLREYDEARKQGVEKPVGLVAVNDPIEQRRIALAKAPLFYVYLEDTYGEQPIRTALAKVVELFRGQRVGYDDLRAALEQTTGKNLAEAFRTWRYSKGIPADFRARYESTPESAPATQR